MIKLSDIINEVKFDSNGQMKIKKQYKNVSDFEKDAKNGEYVWIGKNPNDFKNIGQSYLSKVVGKDSEGNVILTPWKRNKKYTIPQKDQLVFVVESVNEAVNEMTLQKGKTYGGTKCEGGCFVGKEGLKKIIKISKDSPKDVFMFRDDNYSGLQPHFIKNGVIAKATVINPAYDLEKHKVRSLNIGKDVILSVRLFVSTNESIMSEGVWSKIMAGVRKGSLSGPWTIVIIQNKKVIHQEPVKVKDAIPASYEAMKRKFRNAVLSIEDNQGQIVYSERI